MRRIATFLTVWCCVSFAASPPSGPGSGSGSLSLIEVIQHAVARHPGVRIQEEQVERSRGLFRQTLGMFDTQYQASLNQIRVNSPLTLLDQRQFRGMTNNPANLTGGLLGASQLMRNGIAWGPQMELNRQTDRIANFFGLNRSRVGVGITVPLLRGRGQAVVTAPLKAAGIRVESDTLALSQTIAEIATRAARSYWSYVAAKQAMDVMAGSEDRGRVLLEYIEALIDAGQKPRGDRENLVANLADRSASRIAAEQRLVEAQQNLAVSMGLSTDEVALRAMPADDFPSLEKARIPLAGLDVAREYARRAVARRGDIQSATRDIEEAEALSVAARNALRPRVDLNLLGGYAGLAEGVRFDRFFSAAGSRVQGTDVSIGISYSFAPRNNAAQGQLQQLRAVIRQAEWRRADLERTTASSILTGMEGVRNSVFRMENAERSVAAFQRALDGEREKLRLGFGSLVDTLTVEDRLTSALLGRVQARLSYAQSLVDLRFAMGAIVDLQSPSNTLTRDLFFTLPSGVEVEPRETSK